MTNHSLLLWLLLFLDGVFGDEVSVSVMEGDSVTLISGVTEIQEKEVLKWKINNDIIALIDRENKVYSVPGNQESYKDRLKLNVTTGYLTITNIGTSDNGVYYLQISNSTAKKSKIFKITVHGVPVVDKDGVNSLSVMEGDSVTLRTGVTGRDAVNWKFKNGDLNGADAGRENIHLNDQTGNLNITNIQKDQCGVYEVEINTINMVLHRKFNIIIDTMKNISVLKGASVILRTGVTDIQKFNLILWKFEEHPIAKVDRETGDFLLCDSNDKRFKDRLQLSEKTGFLTISHSETTDSGVYQLNMNSNTYSLQRAIKVTVMGLSSVAIALICVSVALVVSVSLVFFYCYRKKPSSASARSTESPESAQMMKGTSSTTAN